MLLAFYNLHWKQKTLAVVSCNNARIVNLVIQHTYDNIFWAINFDFRHKCKTNKNKIDDIKITQIWIPYYQLYSLTLYCC